MHVIVSCKSLEGLAASLPTANRHQLAFQNCSESLSVGIEEVSLHTEALCTQGRRLELCLVCYLPARKDRCQVAHEQSCKAYFRSLLSATPPFSMLTSSRNYASRGKHKKLQQEWRLQEWQVSKLAEYMQSKASQPLTLMQCNLNGVRPHSAIP